MGMTGRYKKVKLQRLSKPLDGVSGSESRVFSVFSSSSSSFQFYLLKSKGLGQVTVGSVIW